MIAAEYLTENYNLQCYYTFSKFAKEDQIMNNNYPVSLFKRHTSLRSITPICFLTNIFLSMQFVRFVKTIYELCTKLWGLVKIIKTLLAPIWAVLQAGNITPELNLELWIMIFESIEITVYSRLLVVNV